jgi:sugar diacid utilization regulator
MKITKKQKMAILAFAECNMNASETARKLSHNRNTVVGKLETVKDNTKLNPFSFYDLIKLVEIAKE